MLQHLTCDSLGNLDGGAARAIIDAAIREAVTDLDDRGDDGKPRQVVINLDLARMENGLIVAEVRAAAKTPPRRTAATTTRLRRSAANSANLLFQSLDPTDPDQRTIDELTDHAKGE